MFDLQAAELVIEAGATITLTSRSLRRGGDFDNSDTIVLVEAEDSGEGMVVEPEGFDPTSRNSTVKHHAFLALRLSDGASAGVTVSSNIRRIVRVTFARVRKLADWAWSNLSCPLCKRAVNALVVAGLTLLGIPVPDDNVIGLVLENLDSLVDYFSASDYDDIWRAVREVLEAAAEVLELWDKFLQAICRKLGACED